MRSELTAWHGHTRRGKIGSSRAPRYGPRTSTFSEADQETLDRFSKDISDYTGRTVSGSAVLRALVRYAGQQRYDWVLAHLPP
jgi:hypothetical protein